MLRIAMGAMSAMSITSTENRKVISQVKRYTSPADELRYSKKKLVRIHNNNQQMELQI